MLTDNKKKIIIAEFREKFGFIAHKGVQCDEITVQNIALFIEKACESIRAEALKEVEDEFEGLIFNLPPNNTTMQFVRDFRSFVNELKGIKDEK